MVSSNSNDHQDFWNSSSDESVELPNISVNEYYDSLLHVMHVERARADSAENSLRQMEDEIACLKKEILRKNGNVRVGSFCFVIVVCVLVVSIISVMNKEM